MKKMILYTFCLISVAAGLILLKDSQEPVLAQSVINVIHPDVIRSLNEMPQMEASHILDLNETTVVYDTGDTGHQFSPESDHELEASNDFTTEPYRILDSDEVIISHDAEHHFILDSQQE